MDIFFLDLDPNYVQQLLSAPTISWCYYVLGADILPAGDYQQLPAFWEGLLLCWDSNYQLWEDEMAISDIFNPLTEAIQNPQQMKNLKLPFSS